MILSPAAFDLVFATGDQTKPATRLTGALVVSENMSDPRRAARPAESGAHLGGPALPAHVLASARSDGRLVPVGASTL